ncbi:hypothetical protein QQG55_55635 [Brugia pahangi]|uniref:Uncharacterized protein n=1 Tax=Brugia pahangi TaxID=6280 RepID=A0A0N4T460_BRUPA|nr:unnamed protein product [Brugia pahangi]
MAHSMAATDTCATRCYGQLAHRIGQLNSDANITRCECVCMYVPVQKVRAGTCLHRREEQVALATKEKRSFCISLYASRLEVI